MIEDTHLIELKGVSRTFGTTQALKDINLYIRKREFVTLLGPSGCGKTTMLRIIGGFETADEGELIFDGKDMSEAYRWGAFDDRGNPPGLVYRDVMCMSERMADEDEEENWKRILYEGDSLTCQLMNIDQGVHEYLTSLRAGQGGGANPKTNISGGCQGYFAAMSIAHADTIVYRHDEVREFEDFADYWKQWSGTK